MSRESGTGAPARTVVKTYGRGSLLGFLSLPFAFLMARQGMRGWQEAAIRDMEDDAVPWSRKGYRDRRRRGEYGMAAVRHRLLHA